MSGSQSGVITPSRCSLNQQIQYTDNAVINSWIGYQIFLSCLTKYRTPIRLILNASHGVTNVCMVLSRAYGVGGVIKYRITVIHVNTTFLSLAPPLT
jgi:hypothetical protein